MKILFLVKYYDGFINSLSEKLAPDQTYTEMIEKVLLESRIFFAPFVKLMRNQGHHVTMVIPNFRALQYQWSKENDIKMEVNWHFDISREQIKAFEPDILFTSSNFEYYDDFMKSVTPYVGKICAWISCPFDNSLDLSHIDHIFTLFEPHYEKFHQMGISTTLTRAAFDHSVLSNLEGNESIDLSFVGGIGAYHKKREALLKHLVKTTPIQIWGYGFKSTNRVKNLIKQGISGFIFNKAYRGEVWGKDMLEVLHSSKITLNVHGDISIGHAVNMRLFEATGTGTLLITEDVPGIRKFFEPGREVVGYATAEEAVEKINYYLKHEHERNEIAMAGQARTLKDYTFEPLVEEYLDVFIKLLTLNEK